MSASGKSSNRLYEYNIGYHTGGGHGIYANEGAQDRQRQEAGSGEEVSINTDKSKYHKWWEDESLFEHKPRKVRDTDEV